MKAAKTYHLESVTAVALGHEGLQLGDLFIDSLTPATLNGRVRDLAALLLLQEDVGCGCARGRRGRVCLFSVCLGSGERRDNIPLAEFIWSIAGRNLRFFPLVC